MENVSFVTHTLDLALLLKYVMNAISAAFKDVVQYVEDKAFQMHITVKNAYKWRRTEMDAQRSSIWEVQKLIYGMKERNMDSKSVEN
jgi:hypothetical protein